MQNMNKRSRKRNDNRVAAGMAVICFLLAVGLFISVFMLGQKQKEINELRQELVSMAEVEEKVQKQTEDSENGGDAAAEENESKETEEAAETSKDSAEDTEHSDKTENTEEAETESPYLESLSGLAPGTVLAVDEIDFSNIDKYFMEWEIEEGDNLYERINGKSYRKNDYVPLSSLRYLKMPHYNFNGQIQVGEMIVSKDVKDDVFHIFKELFQEKYEIQSMYLIDNYWTGNPDTTDSASIDVNNTSSFCYRQATGGGKLSNHAYGKAIDINPQQNPYVSYSTGSPKWAHSNANDYIKRDTGLPHVITHEDLAYKVFKKYGFSWGGDWKNPKDYQHFDK